MKRVISILLTICIFCMLTMVGCAAAEEANNTMQIIMQIGSPLMTVNGTQREIDPGRGTIPVIVNDRTLIPVRAVIEEMNGSVSWSEETQTATLNYQSNEIRLTVDSTTAYLNGQETNLDAAPTVINDRTMLPIRFIAERFGYSVDWEQSTQTITITNSSSASDNLVLVKGGTFTLGSPESEEWRMKDETQHSVVIDDFYISKYEVSQSEYESVTGNNPSYFKGENLPIETVSWLDAVKFCNEKSKAENLSPVYTITNEKIEWNLNADGYRLPTEAEWEVACRAGTDTPFNTQHSISASELNFHGEYPYMIEEYYFDTSNPELEAKPGINRAKTVEVDEFEPNSLGLYNMHGNVSEWVWDFYSEYQSGISENPTGPENGMVHIYRGGNYNDFAKHLRSAYRGASTNGVADRFTGIRLVRSAKKENKTVNSYIPDMTHRDTGKTLIVYFSESGNTRGIAEAAKKYINADLAELEMKEPYSSSTSGLYTAAWQAQKNYEVPELTTRIDNFDEYSTILLGWPTWRASIPRPIVTFLTSYDFTGKRVIPFCSHGSGYFNQGLSEISKLIPNVVLGIPFEAEYSGGSQLDSRVKEWIDSNFNAQNSGTENKILTAYFSRTGTTKALAEKVNETVGGDLYEIRAAVPYSDVYSECTARARQELDSDARPEIVKDLDSIDNYDIILVGYPI